MHTIKSANFREIEKPKSCTNCDNKTHHTSQGWSKCTEIENHLLPWSSMQWIVCDLWAEVKTLTEREKILSKLTEKERKILNV